MALTEAEWTALLSRLSPPDLLVFLDFVAGFAAYEKTGEMAALSTAWLALMARVKEKERIANN